MENTQLTELIRASKVIVLMFEPKQFMEKNKYWEGQWGDIKGSFQKYAERNQIADVDVSSYMLTQQMRMKNCAPETMRWIENLSCAGGRLEKFLRVGESVTNKKYDAVFLRDSAGYEIGIFKNLEGLKRAITDKKANNENPASLLATYEKEWKYQEGEYISKELDLKWHTTGKKESMKDNIWTLSEEIEVGSFHDIQGFDLKYAGVIIGWTYKYTDEHGIVFDRNKHQKVPKDKPNEELAKELISNELKVLLTRGAKGLYIFACDNSLRKVLMNAIQARS